MLGIAILEPSVGRKGVTNDNSYICSLPSRGHAPGRNPTNTPVTFGNSPEGCSGRRVRLEPNPHCLHLSSAALLEVTYIQTLPTSPAVKQKEL